MYKIIIKLIKTVDCIVLYGHSRISDSSNCN